MSIHLRQNVYNGVNAHLHSVLQTPGTDESPSPWRGFHNQFITHIMEALNAALPPGYVAVNEQSLQILGETDGGIPIRSRPIPDVSVMQSGTAHKAQTQAAPDTPTLELTVVETLAPDNSIDAVRVYRQTEHSLWGRPVAHIELLSPSNMPGETNFVAYTTKRSATLRSTIPMIELDLLHESPSPIHKVPLYPMEVGSFAYAVIVSDPRRTAEGRVRVYGFTVDAAMPTVTIPLVEEDELGFNFGDPYQAGYERGPWHKLVDYSQQPVRIETYHEQDQNRIKAVMGRAAQTLDMLAGTASGDT